MVNKDIQSVQSRTSDYTKKISALQESSKQVDENNRQQKAIPNLLNRLMYVMPSEVQITSIKNDTSSHITISAQSSSYAQLGYLTASIKSNGILTSVVSSSGVIFPIFTFSSGLSVYVTHKYPSMISMLKIPRPASPFSP